MGSTAVLYMLKNNLSFFSSDGDGTTTSFVRILLTSKILSFPFILDAFCKILRSSFSKSCFGVLIRLFLFTSSTSTISVPSVSRTNNSPSPLDSPSSDICSHRFQNLNHQDTKNKMQIRRRNSSDFKTQNNNV